MKYSTWFPPGARFESNDFLNFRGIRNVLNDMSKVVTDAKWLQLRKVKIIMFLRPVVRGKQGGRIPKFNMAGSAKKKPSPGCFRQLDCVFQYSCTSFSVLQFHSPILLLCSQRTAGCSLWSWLLVMSHCHDFNWSSNTWIFFDTFV